MITSIILVLGSKNEKRTGSWHWHCFLLQLEICHWTRSRAFWNFRVLLLVITLTKREEPYYTYPLTLPAKNVNTLSHSSQCVAGSVWLCNNMIINWIWNPLDLPGKSAGGKGSLISLTLDSNSSIFSWKLDIYKVRRRKNVLLVWSWVSHLSSGRNAFNTLCPLFSQLLYKSCFLLWWLIRHVGPMNEANCFSLLVVIYSTAINTNVLSKRMTFLLSLLLHYLYLLYCVFIYQLH